MKTAIITAALLLSSMAFAQGEAGKKMTLKTAKVECLKENASLKGKDLAKCIKEKRSH